jgi:Winged helix-turn helix
MCESGACAAAIKDLRPDRRRLEAITKDRNSSQKHVWRAAIVLLSDDDVSTNQIMRQSGTSKTCVWRWQQRFMEEGVDGLLQNKTRPSRWRTRRPRRPTGRPP